MLPERPATVISIVVASMTVIVAVAVEGQGVEAGNRPETRARVAVTKGCAVAKSMVMSSCRFGYTSWPSYWRKGKTAGEAQPY
jgi:hypothetical protein